MTGEDAYERLKPFLPAGMSMFAASAQQLAFDMAIGNERGKQMTTQLRQRIIDGSAEHNFDYWNRPPAVARLIWEADEELLDAIAYFALWYMHRGKTI